MNAQIASEQGLSRRAFIQVSAAAGGGLMLGFSIGSVAGAAAAQQPAVLGSFLSLIHI